jgi:hypothetical protein
MSDEPPPPYSLERGRSNSRPNLTDNAASGFAAPNEVIDLEDEEDEDEDELDKEDGDRALSSGEELDQLVEEMFGMSSYLAF